MDTTTLDQAQETVPGLVVFRLDPSHKPNSPHRWRIGHKGSGLAIADSLCLESAIEGAQLLGTLADWTQDAEALKASIDGYDLFAKLSYKNCIAPGSEPFAPGADVSNNGIYTEADIAEAAAAAKADGLNALDVLVSMSATVPWMGLDTEPFNEAHDRIVQASGAN